MTRTTALLLLGLLLGASALGVAQSVSSGGTFQPTEDYTVSGVWTFRGTSPIKIEGNTATTDDAFETTLTFTDPTADRTWTFGNVTDTVVGRATTDTLTNKTLTSPTLTTPAIGAATGTSLALTGALTSSGAAAGIGYATGAGCAVTQITNRATGVTCTGISGAITTDSTSLAAEASAVFTVTNTSVAVGDVVIVSIRSGMVALNTRATVTTVAAGSFAITVVNGNGAAGTAETGAIIINFAVLKAVSA